MFETTTGRMISGVLPINFELSDMLKLIRDKLDDENAHETMRFLCRNKQLMLNDSVAFAHQKKLITNNVTIRVAKRMIGGHPAVNALIEQIELDAGKAIESMLSKINMECPICLMKPCKICSFRCNSCSKVNELCKQCFVKLFRSNDLTFKCLCHPCINTIDNKQLFASTPVILQMMKRLEDLREMKYNIDSQICICGEFQVSILSSIICTISFFEKDTNHENIPLFGSFRLTIHSTASSFVQNVIAGFASFATRHGMMRQ